MNRHLSSSCLLLTLVAVMLLHAQGNEPVRVDCSAFQGADAGEKIRACLAALPERGGISDLKAFSGRQIISSPIRIDRPAAFLFGAAMFTYTGPDPGTASGVFDIAANDVSFTGEGSSSVIVNAPNSQTIFQIASHQRITFSNFKIDGQEAAHTNTKGYYTGIRSRAGASEIRIEGVEFTAAGDRAIDLRGTTRVWIRHNYFHQTGINIAGQDRARGGNAVSVDVDGKVHSTDTWCEINYAVEWGDSFQCGNERVHILNNVLVGRAAFGRAPSRVEAGIDATGVAGGEILGNVVLEVRGPGLGLDACNTGAEILAPRDVRIEGNIFRATSSLLGPTDPRVSIGQAGLPAQLHTIIFRNNVLRGVRLTISGVDGLTVEKNSFTDLVNPDAHIAVDLNEAPGGILRRFHFVQNLFQTSDGSMSGAFNVGPKVLTPDESSIEDNILSPESIQPVVYQNRAAQVQIRYRAARTAEPK